MERTKLPYGIPNFRTVSEEGYVFVDKTPFVKKLESLGERYIFFLRPRKFGKSLFISMLEHYYDIKHGEKFDKLFGDFYIGKNPTSLHNSYLILLFDFSGIDTTDRETTYEGFLNKTRSGVEHFANKYPDFFDNSKINDILDFSSPELLLERFLTSVKDKTDKRIYLLIDEYDHFANELLAFRTDLFKELVSRTGFVRKFYEVLKTGARDGVIDRMFITGVTPITLDSFTSGFNIGKNLSLHPNFHNMLGFTEKETYNLIEMMCAEHNGNVEEILPKIIEYYNGYKFSSELENSRLFNPNMVLYYLSEYTTRGKPPLNLIDINIASDYRKISNLFNLLELGEVRSIMEDLMEQNQVLGNLTIQFNLEREFERDDLISLMLYTGFITIERQRGNRYIFRMPNYVIGELYYRYFYEMLEKRYSIRVRKIDLDDAIEAMAYDGQIDKFVRVVEEFLSKVLSNRDFRGFREGHYSWEGAWGRVWEGASQSGSVSPHCLYLSTHQPSPNILNIHILTLLFLNGLYYVQSELEAERGYIDIFLREMPQFPVDYEWVLELKYFRKGEAKEMERVKNDGMEQLKRYMQKVRPQTHHNLKGVLLIFGGAGECVSQNVLVNAIV